VKRVYYNSREEGNGRKPLQTLKQGIEISTGMLSRFLTI